MAGKTRAARAARAAKRGEGEEWREDDDDDEDDDARRMIRRRKTTNEEVVWQRYVQGKQKRAACAERHKDAQIRVKENYPGMYY